jgi:hypothetical protein
MAHANPPIPRSDNNLFTAVKQSPRYPPFSGSIHLSAPDHNSQDCHTVYHFWEWGGTRLLLGRFSRKGAKTAKGRDSGSAEEGRIVSLPPQKPSLIRDPPCHPWSISQQTTGSHLSWRSLRLCASHSPHRRRVPLVLRLVLHSPQGDGGSLGEVGSVILRG